MTIWIHAPNVHQGGGRALLLEILGALEQAPDWRCILDQRLTPLPSHCDDHVELKVAPRLFQRLGGEWRLRRRVTADDTVVCFGNLPPLFPVAGRVVVFLQNLYLVEDLPTEAFPARVRLRILLERLWLRTRAKSAATLVVQTPAMRSKVLAKLGRYAAVQPIFAGQLRYSRSVTAANAPLGDRPYDFLYVAGAEPHKNHPTLIAAWDILADRGLYPSLRLTLDAGNAPRLAAQIESLKEKRGVRIECTGAVPLERVADLYSNAKALIYPSLGESFGIPLIEARIHGLPILAAERDYVRDIIDPEQSFDPTSPVSIARAVERYLGIRQLPIAAVDGQQFLALLVRNLN